MIWRTVRKVAARAKVETHVHALRAAFAVHFLEEKPGELVALQKLMGHRRLETTLVYLRRLNRRQAMETVRDLRGYGSPQNAPGLFEAFAVTEKEGFEPSFDPLALLPTAGRERAAVAPTEAGVK